MEKEHKKQQEIIAKFEKMSTKQDPGTSPVTGMLTGLEPGCCLKELLSCLCRTSQPHTAVVLLGSGSVTLMGYTAVLFHDTAVLLV